MFVNHIVPSLDRAGWKTKRKEKARHYRMGLGSPKHTSSSVSSEPIHQCQLQDSQAAGLMGWAWLSIPPPPCQFLALALGRRNVYLTSCFPASSLTELWGKLMPPWSLRIFQVEPVILAQRAKGHHTNPPWSFPDSHVQTCMCNWILEDLMPSLGWSLENS